MTDAASVGLMIELWFLCLDVHEGGTVLERDGHDDEHYELMQTGRSYQEGLAYRDESSEECMINE